MAAGPQASMVVVGVRAFPDLLGPVQVDDDGTTITELGRPALRVRVLGEVAIDVISAHLSPSCSPSRRPVQPARRGRARPLRRLGPAPPRRRGRRYPGPTSTHS
jgi:hypothetical protein